MRWQPDLRHQQPRTTQPPHAPQGVTYLLPHVAPDGTIYTTVANHNPKQGFCCASVFVDKSTDGGATWTVAGTAVPSVTPPPGIYPDTTFRDGIENTFAVGDHLDAQGSYELYVAYEDFSAGPGSGHERDRAGESPGFCKAMAGGHRPGGWP